MEVGACRSGWVGPNLIRNFCVENRPKLKFFVYSIGPTIRAMPRVRIFCT